MDLPKPGDVFDGRYRVDSVLGEGGFATVFEALHLETSDTVALKVLRPDDGDTYRRDTRARFNREIRILDQLRHPNIVEELDFGTSREGLLFTTFEILGGRDLSDLLEDKGRLSAVIVTSILRQLLSALQAAHDHGLLHRDLKPHNIRAVVEQPDFIHVKLLDFGIARFTDEGHPSLTKTGELVGTPRYMSPEQLRGQPLGPSSDIYSLGLLAFELLIGEGVLTGYKIGEQIERLLASHKFTVPELEHANPGLLAIMQRMTEPEVSARYATASSVLRALDALDQSPGYVGPTTGALNSAASRMPATDVRQVAPTPSADKRPIGVRVAVALSAAAVCGALILLVVSALDSPKPQRPTEVLSPAASNVVPTRPPPAVPAVMHDASATRIGAPYEPLPAAVPSSGCGTRVRFRGFGALDQMPAYLPTRYDSTSPRPVVIALHDHYVRPIDSLREFGLEEWSERYGAVLIAPTRAERKWGEPGPAADSVQRQLEYAAQDLCLDLSRVFVLSHGLGGRAALPLACEPWVSAVAVNAFNLRYDRDPKLSRDVTRLNCDLPKPMIWISPLQSDFMPVDGRPACSDKRQHLSVSANRELWRTRNRCDAEAQMFAESESGVCTTWTCESPFVSCTVEGGYPWPGTTRQPTGKLGMQVGCNRKEPAPTFPIVEQVTAFFESASPLPEDAVLRFEE